MFNVFCLLLILSASGFSRAEVPKLHMTVYYASNCPDSRLFVLRQLRPAMRRLQGLVKMQFVPFGIATSIDYGFGGFECQNGWGECLGNIIQDCTLEILDQHGATDMEKLDYVACELETLAGTHNDYQCVQKAYVKPEKVQNCIIAGRGTMLQLNSEYHTSLIDPKYMPAVTFNKVFDQQVQDAAMHDLLGTMCSYLRQSVPCMDYFNKSAWSAIMDRRHSQNYSSSVPASLPYGSNYYDSQP